MGESVDKPVDYYENNFAGTINLLRAMDAGGCRTLVFSSSCTVYGMPDKARARARGSGRVLWGGGKSEKE